jgi:hypothetical protein
VKHKKEEMENKKTRKRRQMGERARNKERKKVNIVRKKREGKYKLG